MRIVRTNPAKSKWTIATSERKGVQVLATGTQRCPPANGIANPIIEAALKFNVVHSSRAGASFYFVERDGVNRFETSASGAGEIFKALNDGRLSLVDGFITGFFTFRKQGREVHLFPYGEGVDGELAAPVPAGAPDLSDLIATLGPTGR